FVAVLFVMMRFQSSANLAAAYGIAVTAIMAISSLLIVIVARYYWQWPRAHVWLLGTVFVSLDAFLFTSTSTKLSDGGWLPISLGGLIFAVMSIWQQQK
ncbi:KUP/HAK/KT family potassium transporter, partial [Vibrio anguillarum]